MPDMVGSVRMEGPFIGLSNADDEEAKRLERSTSLLKNRRDSYGVIEYIRRLKEDAENGKNVIDEEESRNLPRYRGDVSHITSKATWKTDLGYNPQKVAVDLECAIEGDQEMSFNVQGINGPVSDLLANVVEAVMSQEWRRSRMKEKKILFRKDAMIYGTAVGFVAWEDGKDGKPGLNRIDRVDPNLVLFDPDSATNEDLQRSGYVIRYRLLSVKEISDTWPTTPDGEEAREVLASMQPVHSSELALGKELKSWQTTGGADRRNIGYRQESDLYLVVEAWYRDAEVERHEETRQRETNDPDGSALETYQEEVVTPLYPDGRYSVAVLSESGDAVLADGPNLYPHIPFVVFQEASDPTRLFGISLFKNTNSIVRAMNILAGSTVDFLRMTGHPRIKINKFTGPSADSITQADGEIYECNGSIHDAIAFMENPQVPPGYWNAMMTLKAFFDESTGHSDVIRGNKPGSVTAANAIEALQSVSLIRPRQQSRMQMIGFEYVAQMMLANYVRFGGITPRWLALSGEDGQRLLKRLNALQQQGQPLPSFIGDIAQIPSSSGEVAPMYMQWIAEHMQNNDVEIAVDVGVSITKTKLGLAEQAMALKAVIGDTGKSVITDKALLDTLQFPHRDEILEQRAQEASAELQLQQIKPQFDLAIKMLEAEGIQFPPAQGPQGTPPPQQGMTA